MACEGRGRAAAAVREPALHGCGALLQGHGAPTEEQAAQYKEVGDEIDEFDAEDDGPEPGDVVASADLPGGSPEAAWDEFMAEHAKVWMPQFAEACEKDSRVPFYKQAASLLGAFIK